MQVSVQLESWHIVEALTLKLHVSVLPLLVADIGALP